MSGGRTHRPEVAHDSCENCGGCTWHCPAAVFKELQDESDSLRGAIFQARPYSGQKADFPPCRLACPLGQDVPTYISAIAREDLQKAADVIRESNALPSVCGRVCIASCMRACTRAAIDEGVDIRGLKRFAAKVVAEIDSKGADVALAGRGVAVVGAGPAGLAAAHRLVQLGHKAVVFDGAKQAGGLLVDVIPEFVLPREMVAKDVANLARLGVEIRTGVRVGKDVAWNDLDKDFDAVLVATGAGQPLKTALDGAELDGATNALDFCYCPGKDEGDSMKISGTVVVQGGGHAALQSARTAIRRGAAEVHVVHSAPLEIWPAGADAIKIAEEEGINLHPEHRVSKLVGQGKIESVEIRKVRIPKRDQVGRPAQSSDGKATLLTASAFIAASENRKPRKEDQPDIGDLPTGILGNLVVDGEYRLKRSGWYAAGEAASGAATVVDSMATGRLAAEAIVRDLAAKREAR